MAGERYALPYRPDTLAAQLQNFLLDTGHDIEVFHYRRYLDLGETTLAYMNAVAPSFRNSQPLWPSRSDAS